MNPQYNHCVRLDCLDIIHQYNQNEKVLNEKQSFMKNWMEKCLCLFNKWIILFF